MAIAVPAGIEIGFMADGTDPSQQETGPARLRGNGTEIGVGGIGDQQAETQQGEITHQ
ncbi:hypothetical protein D3C72_2451190 [compost metagenome]